MPTKRVIKRPSARTRLSKDLKAMADQAVALRAELLRRGLSPEEALEIAKGVGTAAASEQNGHCMVPGMRIPEEVMR